MTDFLTEHLSEILAFIGGFFAGGVTISFFNKRNTVNGSGSVVDQSKSRAGGDIVGGNKNGRPPSGRSR